jgi:hypothetical protein
MDVFLSGARISVYILGDVGPMSATGWPGCNSRLEKDLDRRAGLLRSGSARRYR